MKQVILPAKCLLEFDGMDARLRAIFWQLLNLWPADTLRVTSIFRTPEQDRKIKGKTRAEYVRGVHTVGPPYRAMDISIWVLDADPDKAQRSADKIGNILNEMWQYDPVRPTKVVAYTGEHGTAKHIHLQVHPNTKRKQVDEVVG